MTLPYQNCGKFDVNDQPIEQASTLNTNNNPNPGGNNPPSPPPPGGGVNPAVEAARIARCNTYLQKPVITNAAALNATVLSLRSGLGTFSGDQSSADVAVNVDAAKGIANSGGSSADNCLPSTTLQVAEETNNSNYAGTFSEGVSVDDGSAIAPANQTAQAATVVARSINNGGSEVYGNMSSVSFRAIIEDNNRDIRCASGSLYFRVNVRVTMTNAGNNPAAMNSDPIYIRANFSNSCWSESKLAMAINTSSANAGHRVAIDGNWAAVLAPKEDNMGAVYIFSKSGSNWNFSQKLTMPGAVSGQVLSNVALRGAFLAVSNATFATVGRVYIFQNSGSSWNSVQTIANVEAGADQKFGIGLALGSNFLAVGASDIANGTNLGKVYIFNASGSSFAYSRSLNPTSEAYKFGQTIAASSSGIAVGAPGAGSSSTFSGAAFVFMNSGGNWTGSAVQKPTLSDAAAFGSSLAFDGTRLAVGSERYDIGNNADAGAVAYYANYSSAMTHSIRGSAANMLLGNSVALSSDSIFVGASAGSPQDGNGNSGFVARIPLANLSAGGNTSPNTNMNSGFVQYSQDSVGTENFGASVASDGSGNVIVGAPAKSGSVSRSGAAYIYGVR